MIFHTAAKYICLRAPAVSLAISQTAKELGTHFSPRKAPEKRHERTVSLFSAVPAAVISIYHVHTQTHVHTLTRARAREVCGEERAVNWSG